MVERNFHGISSLDFSLNIDSQIFSGADSFKCSERAPNVQMGGGGADKGSANVHLAKGTLCISLARRFSALGWD